MIMRIIDVIREQFWWFGKGEVRSFRSILRLVCGKMIYVVLVFYCLNVLRSDYKIFMNFTIERALSIIIL